MEVEVEVGGTRQGVPALGARPVLGPCRPPGRWGRGGSGHPRATTATSRAGGRGLVETASSRRSKGLAKGPQGVLVVAAAEVGGSPGCPTLPHPAAASGSRVVVGRLWRCRRRCLPHPYRPRHHRCRWRHPKPRPCLCRRLLARRLGRLHTPAVAAVVVVVAVAVAVAYLRPCHRPCQPTFVLPMRSNNNSNRSKGRRSGSHSRNCRRLRSRSSCHRSYPLRRCRHHLACRRRCGHHCPPPVLASHRWQAWACPPTCPPQPLPSQGPPHRLRRHGGAAGRAAAVSRLVVAAAAKRLRPRPRSHLHPPLRLHPRRRLWAAWGPDGR